MDLLFVSRDAAGRRGAAQIRERREPDWWILAVGGRVAFSNRRIPINEAPALEIDMVHQVVVPGGLDRGLVGKHQHLLPANRGRQLVTGKGIADARTEEHKTEDQSLMSKSYAIVCLKNNIKLHNNQSNVIR